MNIKVNKTKKKLFITVVLILSILFFCLIYLTKNNYEKNDNKIKVFSLYGTPSRKISELAKEELEKKGYKANISSLNLFSLIDYDVVFEKLEKEKELKDKGKIKIQDVFGRYIGFYSLKYRDIEEIPEELEIYFPDYYLKTYEEKAVKILVDKKLFYLKDKHKGYKLNNIKSKKNFKIKGKYNGENIIFNIEEKLLKEGEVIFLTGSTVNHLKKENKNLLVLEEEIPADDVGLFVNKDIRNLKKIKDFENAVKNAIEKLKNDKDFSDFHFKNTE